VEDKERMRSGCWSGLVFCSFSALTLMTGWQEGHLACKNDVDDEVLFWSSQKRKTQREPGDTD